jgi:hypothetical protein
MNAHWQMTGDGSEGYKTLVSPGADAGLVGIAAGRQID